MATARALPRVASLAESAGAFPPAALPAASLLEPGYWRRLVPWLHCEGGTCDASVSGCKGPAQPGPVQEDGAPSTDCVADSIMARGFVRVRRAVDPSLAARLSDSIERLWDAGWPAPFILA